MGAQGKKGAGFQGGVAELVHRGEVGRQPRREGWEEPQLFPAGALVLFPFLDGSRKRGAGGRGWNLVREADPERRLELGRQRVGGNSDKPAEVVGQQQLIRGGIGDHRLARMHERAAEGEHRAVERAMAQSRSAPHQSE